MPPQDTAPLGYLAALLAAETDSPDVWLSEVEAYQLIRLCLLKWDLRHRRCHVWRADGLHACLTAAYRAAGGYVNTHAGVRSYHAATLRQAARRVCLGQPMAPHC